MDDYYVIKLSFHLFEIVYTLIFHFHRRDLSDFLLHHFVTFMLVQFSYSMNYMPVGAVIMLIHDISDLSVNIFKLSIDYTKTIWIAVTYSLMLSSWIYFRLYFFGVWIIAVIIEEIDVIPHPV